MHLHNLVKFYPLDLKILRDITLVQNVQIMTCNNPNLDLININAYMIFGENLSICSKDIERKRNFGINQRP